MDLMKDPFYMELPSSPLQAHDYRLAKTQFYSRKHFLCPVKLNMVAIKATPTTPLIIILLASKCASPQFCQPPSVHSGTVTHGYTAVGAAIAAAVKELIGSAGFGGCCR